jgi:hypothetical protein
MGLERQFSTSKFLFLIGVVGGGVQLGPLGTAATNHLRCQPRVIMIMEKLVGWWLVGETEVLEENLPQCRFVNHKPPHAARTRTWVAAVGCQRLTAWATARPCLPVTFLRYHSSHLPFIIPRHTIYLWLYRPLLDINRFFSSLILYTVCTTPWTGDQPVARPLPTHRTTQTQNKRTQTFMSWVGFELTIRAFERTKTVHALYRVATVIGPETHCHL